MLTDKSEVRSEIGSRAMPTSLCRPTRNFQSLVNLVPGATPANSKQRGFHAGAFADDECQWHGPEQQQHQNRRRHERISGCRTTWSMFLRSNRSAL